MNGGIRKKMTFEDNFNWEYACWVKNHPKAWRRKKEHNNV